MTEQNGTPIAVQQILDRVKGHQEAEGSTLLLDMEEAMPHLRRFLIGGAQGGGTLPAGRIMIARAGGDLRTSISIPAIGVEAHFPNDSWYGTWETIEHCFEETSTPWQQDYKARCKELGTWRGVVEG